MLIKAKKYKYSVVILRSQPFHFGHQRILENAAKLADKVIVVLGSAKSSQSILNPWAFEVRSNMVCSSDMVESLVPVRDYYYNYPAWLNEVKSGVMGVIDEDTKPEKICIVGARKDYDTQNYLNRLSQFWVYEDTPINSVINATDIRKDYFLTKDDAWFKKVPSRIGSFLHNQIDSPFYQNVRDEFVFVDNYIRQTQFEDPKAYYVQLNTVDVVVMHSNHILMVRRKGYPGKGQLALPGGFIDYRETAHNAAFRELKEETGLEIPKDRLRDFLKGEENGYRFDHPKRDVRGRVATQAFFVNLPDKWDQPQVKGGDDASKALWVPYYDLFHRETEIYGDHIHIIFNLVNKLGQSNT